MARGLLFILLLAIPYYIYASFLNDTIYIRGENYSYGEILKAIDSILPDDSLEKYHSYKRMIQALDTVISKETNSEKITHYLEVGEIFELGRRQNDYILETELNTVSLGYSSEGREIFGYFKGIPSDGYNLIIANIHGAYEYGTYESANFLIEELQQSDSTGWFIIPTLNPDGLEEYILKGKELDAYIDGRDNTYQVDLNRNFCTTNFILREFEKYGKNMLTGVGGCESEVETKLIIKTLENYVFHKVITLHSAGGILYIPDESINDSNVISLGKDILGILSDYDFYPNVTTEESRWNSVQKYEMDEGGKNIFTGTLETYIYEKYNIPTVLIELHNHGKIEYRLKDIFKKIQ